LYISAQLGVLLVSEGRSGSSLVGSLAFDARDDFIYVFEPCRQRGRGDDASDAGKLFGQSCAALALDVLQCSLSQAQFSTLRADRGAFELWSRWGRRLRKEQHESVAYVRWLWRCWTHHRAVKVIRMCSLDLPLPGPLGWLRVVHLLRDAEQVALSRLRLRTFLAQSPLNPAGGAAGVLESVCECMGQKVKRPKLADGGLLRRQSYLLLRFDHFVDNAGHQLRALFAQLGLGPKLPSQVIRSMHLCGWKPTASGDIQHQSRSEAARIDEHLPRAFRQPSGLQNARALSSLEVATPRIPQAYQVCSQQPLDAQTASNVSLTRAAHGLAQLTPPLRTKFLRACKAVHVAYPWMPLAGQTD